jgi:D-alanyl-D-alanine carboxypeptidase
MQTRERMARVMRMGVALAALLCPCALLAQVQIPSTPAGEVFGEWLASYNAADVERIAQFQRTYRRETPVADVLDWRRETGGYELEVLDAPTPTSLTATLREVELPDSRIRFQLTVTPGTPVRIASLDVEQLPTPRLDEATALAALVARTDALVEQDRFSGAVLVSRNGRVLLERAWGLADRTEGTPNTVDTQFRLGSMNKIITAVAILQLVEAGKLALDTPIAAYLPDYPNKEAASKVTIRHLLTHRAGIGEIGFNDSPEFRTPAEFIARRDAMKTPADYVRQYAGQSLAFEPGTRTEYSSLGFMVLGRLIEHASGEDYYDYVQRHVYDVAGMSVTGSLPETTPVAQRAVGYMRQGGAWVANDDTLPYRGSPAGGGYSTVGDLFRFSQALSSGKLLSPAMLTEATRLQSGWQGFGFEVVGEGALANYGHGGMAPGMNAHFRVFPDPGYVIVVLSNFDPPAAGLVYAFLHDRMPIDATVERHMPSR